MLRYECKTITRESVKKHVARMLRDIRDRLSLSECSMLHYALQLSIWEILTNLVDHSPVAAHLYPTHVTIMWTEEEITLLIANEGAAFDWQKHLAAAPPRPLNQERGRGLYIIKSISKFFTYKEDGRTAHIIFDRHS